MRGLHACNLGLAGQHGLPRVFDGKDDPENIDSVVAQIPSVILPGE